MIDPFTAFAALKGATEAISKAIKTGKDLAKMSGAVAKWAKAEAGLQVVASEKPGLFGKLTGAEQNAIDAHFRKEEANRLRDEMRSMFFYYMVHLDSGRDYNKRQLLKEKDNLIY